METHIFGYLKYIILFTVILSRFYSFELITSTTHFPPWLCCVGVIAAVVVLLAFIFCCFFFLFETKVKFHFVYSKLSKPVSRTILGEPRDQCLVFSNPTKTSVEDVADSIASSSVPKKEPQTWFGFSVCKSVFFTHICVAVVVNRKTRHFTTFILVCKDLKNVVQRYCFLLSNEKSPLFPLMCTACMHKCHSCQMLVPPSSTISWPTLAES